MIVLSGLGPVGALVPYDWQITEFVAIWPISTLITFHFVRALSSTPNNLMSIYTNYSCR
jgi:hypothetical protein